MAEGNDWRGYASMTREDLIRRLRAAEDLCVYFGWTGVDRTPRGQACTELWARWYALPGVDGSVKANAELAAAEDHLAATRDEIERRTTRKIEAFLGLDS